MLFYDMDPRGVPLVILQICIFGSRSTVCVKGQILTSLGSESVRGLIQYRLILVAYKTLNPKHCAKSLNQKQLEASIAELTQRDHPRSGRCRWYRDFAC